MLLGRWQSKNGTGECPRMGPNGKGLDAGEELGSRIEGNAERKVTDSWMRGGKGIRAGFIGILLMQHQWFPPQQQQARTGMDGKAVFVYTKVSVIVKKNA